MRKSSDFSFHGAKWKLWKLIQFPVSTGGPKEALPVETETRGNWRGNWPKSRSEIHAENHLDKDRMKPLVSSKARASGDDAIVTSQEFFPCP